MAPRNPSNVRRADSERTPEGSARAGTAGDGRWASEVSGRKVEDETHAPRSPRAHRDDEAGNSSVAAMCTATSDVGRA